MRKITTEEFIKRAKQIHGDKYDYSKVNYINNNTKVCIICPEHGEFFQRAADHLNGCGCQECYGNKNHTTEEFVKKAKKIKPEYDYSKVAYINNKTKVTVICPEHGEFLIRPNDIISGYGCRMCAGNIKKTTEEFIADANEVHNFKYDYSQVNYNGARNKVEIICHCVDKNNKEHGIFYQEPLNHLNGSGCPRCNSGNKSKMEENIGIELENVNLKIERQKTFEWLKYRKHLYLDFYLPDYGIAVEVQGDQHYQSIERFGGYSDFIIRQQRDIIKKELCEKHNIKIIYITKKDYSINKILDLINGNKATN